MPLGLQSTCPLRLDKSHLPQIFCASVSPSVLGQCHDPSRVPRAQGLHLLLQQQRWGEQEPSRPRGSLLPAAQGSAPDRQPEALFIPCSRGPAARGARPWRPAWPAWPACCRSGAAARRQEPARSQKARQRRPAGATGARQPGSATGSARGWERRGGGVRHPAPREAGLPRSEAFGAPD